MQIKKNKQKAFSLIELITAMFVFSVVIMVTVAIFVNVVHVRKKSKHVQQNMEDIKYVMELMSKVIRMSSKVTNVGSNQVIMYNNSQNKCISYRFTGSSLESASNSDDRASCGLTSVFPIADYTPMVNGSVTGKFSVTPSSNSPPHIGKVVITMSISAGSGSGEHAVNLQTTLSLRNYEDVGI